MAKHDKRDVTYSKKINEHKDWIEESGLIEEHFSYRGSLTTPRRLILNKIHIPFSELVWYWKRNYFPVCNEGVTWIIAKNVVPVKSSDMKDIQNLINDEKETITTNHRPLQNSNNRKMYYFSSSGKRYLKMNITAFMNKYFSFVHCKYLQLQQLQ